MNPDAESTASGDQGGCGGLAVPVVRRFIADQCATKCELLSSCRLLPPPHFPQKERKRFGTEDRSKKRKCSNSAAPWRRRIFPVPAIEPKLSRDRCGEIQAL